MKLQSMEARVRHALLRDGLSASHARKAAAIAARELHVERGRIVDLAIAAGLSFRRIGRLIGVSYEHVRRLSHRHSTDVTPATSTVRAPDTE